MRIEFKNYTVTQLNDGRILATHQTGFQFIVDSVDEAMEAIKNS